MQLNFIYLFIAYAICAKSDWSYSLYDYLNHLKPYQLMIFESFAVDGNLMRVENSPFRRLHKTFPSVLIDLSKNHTEYNTFTHFKTKYSQYGVIIYFQLKTNNDGEIQNFINFYENQYPKQPRQKCLVIYLTHEAKSQNSVQNILRYGWQKKFLDFTILEICKNNGEAFFYTFNPFFRNVDRVEFSNGTKLFPNKLHNLNKYPFILPMYAHNPYVTLENDSAGETRLKYFLYKSFLLTVLEEMNFLVRFKKINYTSIAEVYADIFNNLKNNNLNMGLTYLSDIPESLPILPLRIGCNRFMGVMKYQLVLNFNVSLNILFGYVSVITIILYVKLIIVLLKIPAYNFDFIDVIRIAVTMPLTSLSKTSFKKTITVIAFFSSLLLSAKFHSFLTKIATVNEEVSFNSLDEIYKSEFKIVTTVPSYKIIFESLDDSSKELFKQNVKAVDSIRCPHYALENEKTICIVTYFKLQVAIKNSKDLSQIMRILPFDFFCSRKSYPFETASPYLRYFELIFQRMYESGIFNWLDIELKTQKTSKIMKNATNEESKVLLISLMSIMALGGTISLGVFIFEIIRFHVKNLSVGI